MHVHFLDPYRPLISPVHKLDGRVKFFLTVAFIVTTSLTPFGAWPVYVLLLALVLSAEMLSALGVGYVLRRTTLALPFVLAAVPLLFTIEGVPLFSLRLGPWTASASFQGLERFVNVALKSWLSVQAAIVLASSTPFPDLLLSMRAVRLPRLLVAMFGLMWRYLFVLADEALRLIRARAARSGLPDEASCTGDRHRPGGSLAWRAQVAGGMAGNLFLRAFERSDRIYVAMLSRGYDGEPRALSVPKLAWGAWGTLAGGLILLGGLLAFGIVFWG
jgi:cobalt/nickel transport system permease protein